MCLIIMTLLLELSIKMIRGNRGNRGNRDNRDALMQRKNIINKLKLIIYTILMYCITIYIIGPINIIFKIIFILLLITNLYIPCPDRRYMHDNPYWFAADDSGDEEECHNDV